MTQLAFDFGPEVISANAATFRKYSPERDEFYDSLEWRTARVLAKRRAHWRCENSGCMSRGIRCFLHVHHIIPRVVRPDLALALHNLQVLCDVCHATKTMQDGVRYGWG